MVKSVVILVIILVSFVIVLANDMNPLSLTTEQVTQQTKEFTGKVYYKGAYYRRHSDEVYYILVEDENGGHKTFYVPSFLWLQLKVGTDWTYLPVE
jgi:uncharacterized protein YpmB